MNNKFFFAACIVLLGITVGLIGEPVRGAHIARISSITPHSDVTTPGAKVILDGSGFLPGAEVYFGGMEARDTGFISASKLEVTTPYLRPGDYKIEVVIKGSVTTSDVTFTSLPAPVDSEIDRAIRLAGQNDASAALDILNPIAASAEDYQVRASAYYQMAQIHFALGDLPRWDADVSGIFLDADKAGRSVQTYWKYRLADSETRYYLHPNSRAGFDTWYADKAVQSDVTQNPELRFFRGLLYTRHGDLSNAKIDTSYLLSVDPTNPSYRALDAYVAALGGDKSRLQSLPDADMQKDPRALRILGEAAFLAGDRQVSRRLWSDAAKADPSRASLTCLAGENHLRHGERDIAAALTAGCSAMAPANRAATKTQNR